MMDMTRMMAQQSPQGAMGSLVNWVNTRYQLNWTTQDVIKLGPEKVKAELQAAGEKFLTEGRLEKEVQTAMATRTADELAAYFKTRLNIEMPESMRYLEGQERADAIRSKIESILRAELLYLERTMLLEVLDEIWKGHLYQMDQLQDAIHFRVYSQQDPRYEFKREGSRLMNETMNSIRDRVTDYIFKVTINPAPPQPPMAQPGGGARPAGRPAVAGAAGGSKPGGGDPYYSPPGRGAGPAGKPGAGGSAKA
jgi:preprotein translocase subunit SecA